MMCDVTNFGPFGGIFFFFFKKRLCSRTCLFISINFLRKNVAWLLLMVMGLLIEVGKQAKPDPFSSVHDKLFLNGLGWAGSHNK